MNTSNSIFRPSKPIRRFSDSSSTSGPQAAQSQRRPLISRSSSDSPTLRLGPSPTDTTPQGHGARPRHISLPLSQPYSIQKQSDLGPSPVQPPVPGSKRSSVEQSLSPSSGRISGPSRKKLRLFEKPYRPLHPYNSGSPGEQPATPPSPLFFSNSPQRPSFPTRYSSSEAAAKMLSKTKGEDTAVKTVTLPRASYPSGNPHTSRPKPKSHLSHETTSSYRTDSPMLSDDAEQFNLLSHIGVTELLELDDRPTFIVDLADPTNPEDGTLKILFANIALQTCGNLLDAVSGKAGDAEPNSTANNPFSQFKEWLLGASGNVEVIGACLPAFIQGSISWSCTTLRERLRVVSGTLLSHSPTEPYALSQSTLTVPLLSTTDASANAVHTSPDDRQISVELLHRQEPKDYFGDAGAENTEEISNVANIGEKRIPSNDTSDAISSYSTPDPLAGASPLESRVDRVVSSSIEPLAASDAMIDPGFFDWTRLPNISDLPPHIQFAREIDWGATALGPIETWSADLRQMCNLIMASPHPAAMYWGEDLVAIYNEAYVFLAGQKHPQLMGQSYREAWAEIWDEVKDVFAGAQRTGQATMKDDDCLFIRRSDSLEETYFSWSIIPMVGGDGYVMGLYNPAFEKTRRKIAERRMLTLREVGERTAAARDVKSFWGEVLAALDCNAFDTPFVLLYSLVDEDSSDGSSVASSSRSGAAKQCILEGSLGVPEGHPAAPEVMDLRFGANGFAPVFREVIESHRPAILDVVNGDISKDLLDGFEWRGFGDPARAIVVCPIHPTTGDNTLGFLVMGINPRRPYDDDYSLFIQLLSRQLATSLASVVLIEEEIKRGQRAAKMAALDRFELSEQLAARTQEVMYSETKFTRMAEFAPVGMFIADSEGRITYCNDTWYGISRVPKEEECTDKWIDFVMDEDRPLVSQLWHELVEKTKPVSAEWRFKAPSTNQDGSSGPTWVLFSAYPEKDDQGALNSVFGSITNISQQKWAEGLQKKKTEEAIELKRQQENFIDTTSHEMRNPLSAILQCADEIVSSLSEARLQTDREEDVSLYSANIDAAQTIALCAQHQKRIVDDVLTVSKLDSALLVVAPVDAQPMGVVQRVLKMFEGEFQNADIDMQFIIDPSYEKLNIDWVRFDPSRVLQVLINLTTNAIKFTTTQQKRTIAVTLSASLARPSADESSFVSYIPRRPNRADSTQSPEWGSGEEVYIHFSVQDTGRGLSEDEKKNMFLRFKQASPRTHVQYGGSGLGLFISRELTELQGGEIGVASVADKGSTFAFFVKARRSTAAAARLAEQLPTALMARRTSDGKGSKRVGSTTSESPSRGEVLKVLIVEDNLVNQRVLQKQLIKNGCEVHVANHGGETLDKLRESTFWHENRDKKDAIELQIVLLDQEMPVMDGLTCIKRIREMEENGELIGHVPVIAVTANARQEQIDYALSHGMDRVITKPFQIPEILEKMKALVKDLQKTKDISTSTS